MSRHLEKLKGWGDPPADDAVEKIFPTFKTGSNGKPLRFEDIEESILMVNSLQTNVQVLIAEFGGTQSSVIRRALNQFARQSSFPPPWMDKEKVIRAEALFQEHGVLVCVLLLCASLPEVYILPSISSVLRTTGYLAHAAENRIRSTATMILAVLLEGGMRKPDSGGVAYILRARYIHGVLRHFSLQGNPKTVIRHKKIVPPYPLTSPPKSLCELLLSGGWNLQADGVPCNQEEMAYTLLTFSYVFLRSLRRLGLGLKKEDEIAYLHFWNVVGHYMGIQKHLLAFTMKEAEDLFETIQHRARRKKVENDPRPALGQALVEAVQKSVSISAFRFIPALLVRHLTSKESGKDLKLGKFYSRTEAYYFSFGIHAFKVVDRLVQLLIPKFSLMRFILRIVGFHVLNTTLKNPAQPLRLSPHMIKQVHEIVHEWSRDPQVPGWVNEFEDYFTVKGSWREPIAEMIK